MTTMKQHGPSGNASSVNLDSEKRQRPQYGRRIVYGIAALLLIGAVLGVFLPAIHRWSPAESTDGVGDLLDREIERFHETDRGTPVIRLVMTINQAKPADRTVSLSVSARFYDIQGPHPISFVDQQGRPIIDDATGAIRPEYAEMSWSLFLDVPSSGHVEIPFRLADVNGRSTIDRTVTVTVDLPTDAYPQSFPNDAYNFDTYLWFSLPSGVFAVTTTNNRGRAVTNIPVAASFAPGKNLVGWRLSSGIELAKPDKRTGNLIVMVPGRLTRPVSYLLFVYAVALTPALLGISYLVHHLGSRRRGLSEASGGLEIAAALLALLALRQVLVPSDITGLTWLDELLGVELVAFSGLAAVTFAGLGTLPPPGLPTQTVVGGEPQAVATPSQKRPSGSGGAGRPTVWAFVVTAGGVWITFRVLYRVLRRSGHQRSMHHESATAP
jgi:hypothetical protein